MRQKEVRELVQENRVSLLGLVETKVSMENRISLSQNLFRGWSFLNNYSKHPNGRIWILWNPEISDVRLLYKSDQMIHVSATIIEKQTSFLATFVYGLNTPGERLSLWQDIKQISTPTP